VTREVQAIDQYRAQHGRVGKRTIPYQGTLVVDHANCAIHKLHALDIINDPQANALDHLARDWKASNHQVGGDVVSSYELTDRSDVEITPRMEAAWERCKEAHKAVGSAWPTVTLVAIDDKEPTDALWKHFLVGVNRLAKHYGYLRG
jgi:hypothetical protein